LGCGKPTNTSIQSSMDLGNSIWKSHTPGQFFAILEQGMECVGKYCIVNHEGCFQIATVDSFCFRYKGPQNGMFGLIIKYQTGVIAECDFLSMTKRSAFWLLKHQDDAVFNGCSVAESEVLSFFNTLKKEEAEDRVLSIIRGHPSSSNVGKSNNNVEQLQSAEKNEERARSTTKPTRPKIQQWNLPVK